MIKRLTTTLLLFTYLFTLQAQDQPKYASKVLFTLGEDKYTLGEFEYYFLKNSERPSADSAKIAIQDYLDLFVKFRLKVQEAEALGMDKDPAFIQEYEGYKKQLVEPFLTSTQFEEKLVLEAYERMKTEVSASHILLKTEPNALPEDTLKVYNRLMDLKNRIDQGEDFETLAKQYSEDPSAKMNGGFLGYFSSMQMVYPFENAAYNNEIGSVIGPIRTRFGFHLVYIKDKRPARGQILTAHIMLRHNQDSASDKAAKEKADMIYKQLQQGGDWSSLCLEYSQDVNTAKNAGELRWFGTGALVPSFENAAFALDSIGQISVPIRTRFGWHIIKLLGKKDLAPYEELKADLERRIKRDDRSKAKQSVVIKTIKKSQAFKLDSVVYNQAFQTIDTTLLEGKWSYDVSTIDDQTLISMNDGSYSLKDFYNYVLENQKKRHKTDLDTYIEQLYNRFEQQSIYTAEEKSIERNNTEYRMLLDEYKSGILLFNLMEDEVWGKAMKDSAGLEAYFELRKEAYQKPDYAVIRKVTCSDSIALLSAQEAIEKAENSDSTFVLNIEGVELNKMQIEKGENSFIDQNWNKGNYVEQTANGYTIWLVDEIVKSPEIKLDDVKGQAISDYQQHLEKEWIEKLRVKFPLKISNSVLKYYVKTFK